MNGRIVVVTGAAQGNGRAIAERLVAEGATVVCGDSDEDALRRTVRAALNRIARPDEAAALALFLCSDESSFCSGRPFTIDGR